MTTCADTSPTSAQLAYDAEGRLTHWQNAPTNPTSQAWYLYDGEGHRVEQVVSGGSSGATYYLPGNVEEVTPTGALTKYYTAGGLTLGLNTAPDASGLSYLVSDGLGSVSEALVPSGLMTAGQLYGPYGAVRYTTVGTLPTSRGFTGQYADTSSDGLDYYGARYYDPLLGQFTSADTVADGTDGLNRYGYVNGNPTTATDPSGHCPWCIIGAIAGAVVGAAVVYGAQVVSNMQNGGSLTDAATWAPTDWGAIGKGALVGAVVGGTMGAAATVIAGAGTAGVTVAAVDTASDVMFNSALGAGEGFAQGVVSGDTGGDLVFDAAAGAASENAGYAVGKGFARALAIDDTTRGGRIATTVVGNASANVTSQAFTGQRDGYSFVLSVGLGVAFGGMRIKAADKHSLALIAGGTDFLVQTGVSSYHLMSGSIVSTRPQQIHDGRVHPW